MQIKSFILSKDDIPKQWYNILADIKMNPPLGPDGNPISPDMLALDAREADRCVLTWCWRLDARALA